MHLASRLCNDKSIDCFVYVPPTGRVCLALSRPPSAAIWRVDRTLAIAERSLSKHELAEHVKSPTPKNMVDLF